MPDGMTFKENIQNEKNKWNNMNWKQRFSYFKTYYMIPLIVILIIISVIVYLILQTLVFRKDIIMAGVVANFDLSDEAIESVETGYMDFVDGNTRKECVNYYSIFVSEVDYNSIMAIDTRIASSTIDFMIVDKEVYELLNGRSAYANLENVLDDTVLQKLDDKIIDTTDVDTQIEYPAAIDISDTEYAHKYLEGKEAYLVFIVNSNHLEDVPQILDFFLSYK